MSSTEFVEFQKIKEYIQIKDVSNFMEYLREIYKDLSSREEEAKTLGISKIPFLDYIKLPIFVGEKLFNSFDLDKNNHLSLNEFLTGMKNLYLGNFEETALQVFKILDFDLDGFVLKEDTKILLTYLPLKNEASKSYKYQMESLNEIEKIVNETFNKNKKISFTEFLYTIEKVKSDVYLQILCFLYQNKPFKEETFSKVALFKKRNSLEIKDLKTLSPIINKRIISPNKKTTLSPFLKLFPASDNTPFSSGFEGVIRMPNEKVPINPSNDDNKELKEILKESKSIYNSPTKVLKKEKDISEFSLDLISTTPSEEEDTSTKNSSPKSDAIQSMEGKLIKITKKGKLKPIYYVLNGLDLYIYSSSTKERLNKMHNLSGWFVKSPFEKKIGHETYTAFQLKQGIKIRTYVSKSKTDIQKIYKVLKETLGYLNFFDYYEIIDEIGNGQFGVVKLGVHKKTKERVAIKIIKKEGMKAPDIELVRNEIDIMKLCHHPNIVKLLDHFENVDYIFIVMEYLSGGELQSYLTDKKFKFTENQAAKMIKQIGEAVKYIQQFGIIHRDLKPGNIMLAKKGEEYPTLKIMDFGLGKICGPNEKLNDGYGTLSFVAPEILLRTPYNKQIDIWSIGIILYYILSGELPFDDPENNEDRIANQIVFEEVKFSSAKWGNRSKEVKDLILKCLCKDINKRILITDLLQHPWIKNAKN